MCGGTGHIKGDIMGPFSQPDNTVRIDRKETSPVKGKKDLSVIERNSRVPAGPDPYAGLADLSAAGISAFPAGMKRSSFSGSQRPGPDNIP